MRSAGATPPQPAPDPAPKVHPTAAPRSARVSGDGQMGRLVGFVAMGVGGAALLTGGVFGVLALRDEARLSARCPTNVCTPDRRSQVDSYESKKLVSGIGLISGVLLGAGGAALYVFSSSSGRGGDARAGIYWAGNEAGVWGAF